jgi:hypothetical protein
MKPAKGPLAESTAICSATSQPGPRALARLRRAAVGRGCGLLLCAALVVGCGEDPAKQQAAYDSAMADVERERTSLKNIRSEMERIYGEYLLHNFESQVWSGEFSPRNVLRLSFLNDQYGRSTNIYAYLYRKVPLPWTAQIDRLFSDRPEVFPWYDRTKGEVYRRRVQERYARMLIDLRDRVALQTERVKSAEEYARILKPGESN